MIKGYQVNNTIHSHTENTPDNCIEQLKEFKIEKLLPALRIVRICLQTEKVTWMEKFIKLNGINILFDTCGTLLETAHRSKEESECIELIIECFYSIANVPLGIQVGLLL